MSPTMKRNMFRLSVPALVACLALSACANAPKETASTPSRSASPSASTTPTPPRTIGLADARATAYGMYTAVYDSVNVGAVAEPETPCGSVRLGNGQGWFTVASEKDVTKPDAPASRATAWAAWALADSEIDTTDKAIADASACTGEDNGWAEKGSPETLSAPFAGPGARLSSTKDERQSLRIFGRVGHLLISCQAQDLAAGDAQGDTHIGLTGCMDRGAKMAELAQVSDLSASTDSKANMLLASRAQLEGMNTFPNVTGLTTPCAKGTEFISLDGSSRVTLADKGHADFPKIWVAVEAASDVTTARQAMQAQQDIAADCSGDYTWTYGTHSLPMVLTAGVATTTGDGGLAFASAEKNSATLTTYNYSEVFTMGVFKVQVTSLNQETPEEAKRLVEAAVQKVVSVS